jgi:hypothetical protein
MLLPGSVGDPKVVPGRIEDPHPSRRTPQAGVTSPAQIDPLAAQHTPPTAAGSAGELGYQGHREVGTDGGLRSADSQLQELVTRTAHAHVASPAGPSQNILTEQTSGPGWEPGVLAKPGHRTGCSAFRAQQKPTRIVDIHGRRSARADAKHDPQLRQAVHAGRCISMRIHDILYSA